MSVNVDFVLTYNNLRTPYHIHHYLLHSSTTQVKQCLNLLNVLRKIFFCVFQRVFVPYLNAKRDPEAITV